MGPFSSSRGRLLIRAAHHDPREKVQTPEIKCQDIHIIIAIHNRTACFNAPHYTSLATMETQAQPRPLNLAATQPRQTHQTSTHSPVCSVPVKWMRMTADDNARRLCANPSTHSFPAIRFSPCPAVAGFDTKVAHWSWIRRLRGTSRIASTNLALGLDPSTAWDNRIASTNE